MCVVQVRASDAGMSRWVRQGSCKTLCYCRINAKTFNLQPQLIFYWLKVAVTGRNHWEASMCR